MNVPLQTRDECASDDAILQEEVWWIEQEYLDGSSLKKRQFSLAYILCLWAQVVMQNMRCTLTFTLSFQSEKLRSPSLLQNPAVYPHSSLALHQSPQNQNCGGR